MFNFASLDTHPVVDTPPFIPIQMLNSIIIKIIDKYWQFTNLIVIISYQLYCVIWLWKKNQYQYWININFPPLILCTCSYGCIPYILNVYTSNLRLYETIYDDDATTSSRSFVLKSCLLCIFSNFPCVRQQMSTQGMLLIDIFTIYLFTV